MAVQRADILYPVNSTTIDTAAGIDIRFLDDAQGGATDSDQSVRFTHTQDGQERTFDPDNALVTTETDPLTFQGEGWATNLADDMTPVDDTNCNTAITAQTLVVQVRALLNQNGGTNLGGNTVITFRASLWRYNTSANTGVLIASGSQSNTWDTSTLGAENNTRKNTSISIVVASDTEFLANEVFFLQLGCEGTTLPNASIGTTNFDITLDVDDPGTFLDFAANEGIRQFCVLTYTLPGKGTTTEGAKLIEMEDNLNGVGTIAFEKSANVNKTFSLTGKGTTSHTKAIEQTDFNFSGKGTLTHARVTVAAKAFTLAGKGTATQDPLEIAMSDNLVGKGTATQTKVTVASKTFNLVGKGTLTEIHPVQAFRTFNLKGKGTIPTTGDNASTITIPIDEVPTGGGGDIIINKKSIFIFDD